MAQNLNVYAVIISCKDCSVNSLRATLHSYRVVRYFKGACGQNWEQQKAETGNSNFTSFFVNCVVLQSGRYVDIKMHVCTNLLIYIYIYMHTYMCIYINIHMYVYRFMCIHIRIALDPVPFSTRPQAVLPDFPHDAYASSRRLVAAWVPPGSGTPGLGEQVI